MMDYKTISEELKNKLQEIKTLKDKLKLKDAYKNSDNLTTLKPTKKDFKEYNNITAPVEKGGLNFGIHIDHFTGKYNSSNKKIGLWKEEKEEKVGKGWCVSVGSWTRGQSSPNSP